MRHTWSTSIYVFVMLCDIRGEGAWEAPGEGGGGYFFYKIL